MASSAPNPYGQPQAPALSAPATAGSIYYADYSQLVGQGAASTKHAGATEVDLQHQQQRVDSTPRRVAHQSSSSLSNYDGYLGGMSSDSELTTTSTAARHHHRPYSSQSRVYHAHPVPRNSPAPATRLSHYSSSSAIQQQQPQQQQQQHPAAYSVRAQQQLNNQASSINTPSHQPLSSINHQGSFASSAASYLAGSMTQPIDAAVSPVLAGQPQPGMRTGRQLPQRPFKQSMSIDHHSMGNQSYKTASQIGSHHQSPSHQSPIGHMHRNMTGDQLGAHYQQQQKSYPGGHQLFESTSNLYSESANQRNLRFEMDLMEKQAANLSLYEAGIAEHNMADLPPCGPLRTSSAASRHLPSSSQTQAHMMDQHQTSHHQADPYHQHHHDPYSSQSQSAHHKSPIAGSSAEWLPQMPAGGSPMGSSLSRAPNQFKHTMSIDHYSAAMRHHQQQQRHFSPARQGQFSSTDHYRSPGSYAGHHQSSLVGSSGYESAPSNQAHDYASSDVAHQDPTLMKYHHYPSQSANQSGLHHQAGSSLEHAKSSYGKMEASIGNKPTASHPLGRPNLQHQPSSSSSNSNLSGSLTSAHIENVTGLDNKPSSSGEHQKSITSASTHYQHSPQHKLHHAGAKSYQTGTRQDLLRRGYTSIATSSAYGEADFGGSQGALSESGDLSVSQTSHSGQGSSKRSGMRAASPSMALEPSTSSTSQQHHPHHHHHSTSGSYTNRETGGIRSESSTGLPNGAGNNSALTKKSSSATQLSMTGTKKRLGFRKKQVTSFSVHRSEEVAPLDVRHLVKQGSSVSEGDSSMSGDSSSRSWSNSNFKPQTSEELASMSFIDGLGKGQMISRQGLASPYLGDIQLSLCDRRGNLEIEIIRARNLQAKTNKIQPLTYVKLYLVKNRKCLAKAKTTLSNKRTLNPLFQQQLTFHEDYHGCILQSIVWGNFGKMDKKNFMGIAQISIDDLELSDTVISWYKLFLPSSLQTLPSKSLRHTLLSNSTESFTNTQNS